MSNFPSSESHELYSILTISCYLTLLKVFSVILDSFCNGAVRVIICWLRLHLYRFFLGLRPLGGWLFSCIRCLFGGIRIKTLIGFRVIFIWWWVSWFRLLVLLLVYGKLLSFRRIILFCLRTLSDDSIYPQLIISVASLLI